MSKFISGIAIIVCTTVSIINAQVNPDCRVVTESGELEGITLKARGGQSYCGFLGVPYAEYPGRFQAATSFKNWTGLLIADKPGSACPQSLPGNDGSVYGKEDCLFLNVYYPIGNQCENETANKYPVMVHIHGGTFLSGEGVTFGPEFLLEECLVYVSINYRLGALGFLTTSDGIIPGNLGLKDQVMALAWVQEHIGSFGGDANLVTAHGISAGSSAVSHLLASPTANGLFQRAVAQSASAFNPWAFNRIPDFWTTRLANVLNCPEPLTSENMKSCLLAKSTEDIIRNQNSIRLWWIDPILPFGPVAEPEDAIDPFITQSPHDAYRKGEVNPVPLMIGFVKDESIFMKDLALLMNKTATEDLDANWDSIAPIYLDYFSFNIPPAESDNFTKQIREFYFQNRSISWDNIDDLTKLNSDRLMYYGILANAQLHAGFAPTFPYVFNYTGEHSLLQFFNYTKSKLSHGDDMQYLLRAESFFPGLTEGSPDEEFSKKYVKLILSFMKSGVPTETWPENNMWEPMNSATAPEKLLEINSDCLNITNSFLIDRLKFWENLGILQYESPQSNLVEMKEEFSTAAPLEKGFIDKN